MTRKWIILIMMSLVTVVVWVVLEVSFSLMSDEAELDYQAYLEPLAPTFNEEALEDILTREDERLLIDRDALE
jgi:hypothetical protein